MAQPRRLCALGTKSHSASPDALESGLRTGDDEAITSEPLEEKISGFLRLLSEVVEEFRL